MVIAPALSIRAAAATVGRRVALVAGDAQLTYAELAAACAAAPDGVGPVELVATPSVETVVAILAAFDRGRPLILQHPRATAAQRAQRAAAVRHAKLPVDTLAIVFTSGTTGEPRPVALGRRGALAAAAASAAHLGWHDDDAWLLCVPLAHVAGLAILVRCLVARRTVVLATATDPAAIAGAARAARATLASCVPTQLADFLAANAAIPSLRAILLGGAACPRPLRAAACARGLPILTTYGMTETWGQVATQPLARAGLLDAGVGIPLPGVTILAGTPEAPSQIEVISDQIGHGHGHGHGHGRHVTSDLGFFTPDGYLHVVGRADDVIITGGENVHPDVVEDAIATAPGVTAACVFGVPDPRWGERVVAAVVLERDADVALVAAHAADRLATHERPREWRRVEQLPRTAAGKIDRSAVRRVL